MGEIMPYIPMPDFSIDSFKSFTVSIGGKSYTFSVRWNNYCETPFLQISYNGEDLLEGEYPLVCGGVIKIDHRKLLKLMFGRIDGELLASLKETFKEYGIFYAK